jgi:PKD repeat protein
MNHRLLSFGVNKLMLLVLSFVLVGVTFVSMVLWLSRADGSTSRDSGNNSDYRSTGDTATVDTFPGLFSDQTTYGSRINGELTQLTAQIEQSEYHVRWVDKTYLPDLPAAYQAPNRAHNLRTYFDLPGIRVISRDATSPEWEWGLRLTAYGYGESLQPVGVAQLQVAGNRVEYERENLVEWYINDERGLEQGFTLKSRPMNIEKDEDSGQQGNSASPLVLSLEIVGDLRPVLDDNRASIDFVTVENLWVLRYGHLYVFDTNGNEAPAYMSLVGCDEESEDGNQQAVSAEQRAYPASCSLHLIIDDRLSAYPLTIDPIATDPDWEDTGGQENSGFGYSVASAGDVNGDGYDDVIVGAYLYDTGELDAGKVFVYYGSANGLSQTADWTAEGNQANAYFGFAASNAGDINGDGYADVIIGAYRYSNGQNNEGAVFVYHGSANGLSQTPDWMMESNLENARFGYAVAGAGDVNGEGYDGVIIGAPALNGNRGRVYLFSGSPIGLGSTPTWMVSGEQSGSRLGWSVSGAGDVNGDGYKDLVIGAPLYNSTEIRGGAAFIYHGPLSGTGSISDAAWVVWGGQAEAQLGHVVAGAGDVNGDGYDDVIISAPKYNSRNNSRGKVFVYYGSSSGLSLSNGWSVASNGNGVIFGTSVAGAGDVDGDSFDDIIIGAPYAGRNGKVFIYYGSANGLAATRMTELIGPQAKGRFGWSVNSAGDVNGDGFADVVIGAVSYSEEFTAEGAAFAYYGQGAAFTAEPLSGVAPLTVTFSNISVGATDYLWRFGDGVTSTITNPVHIYQAAGVYTVSLRMSNAHGSTTLTRTNYIAVSPPVGQGWQLVTTSNAPPVRGEYALAYDNNQGIMVLYGGNAVGWPYENDTWEFDGTDWSIVNVSQRPSAVYGMSMVYDSYADRILLFGGSDATDGLRSETWQYSGGNWSQLLPTTFPAARSGHTMVYTSGGGGQVFLFGGQSGTTYFHDLWQYSDNNWTQLIIAGVQPPARALHGLTYNENSGLLYLFGGRDATGNALDDFWTFDPHTAIWTEIPGWRPAARWGHSLIYHPGLAALVLVGGASGDGETLLNDSLHYQAGDWQAAENAPVTAGLVYHTLVYREATNDLLLFANGQTWQYR